MTTSPRSSEPPTGNLWLYPLLLAVQTLGAALIYTKTIPLYQHLMADPSAYETRRGTRAWLIAAIALIQVGYWVCYRMRPQRPHVVNPLLGHVIQCVARLVFLLATTVFAFVFFLQRLASLTPAPRYVLILIAVFSLYCYAQELERWGKAFLGPEK